MGRIRMVEAFHMFFFFKKKNVWIVTFVGNFDRSLMIIRVQFRLFESRMFLNNSNNNMRFPLNCFEMHSFYEEI